MSYENLHVSASRSKKSLILTATDLAASAVMPVALLSGLALEAETEVLDWNKFFSRLLNPVWRSNSEEITWMILLQVEDWDHFLEHARNPAVTPSPDFLERKFSELIYLLGSFGNQAMEKLIIGLLPPPDEVIRNASLMAFREKLCNELKESLTEYSSIRILSIPSQLTSESTIHEDRAADNGSRIVYRIPINARDQDK